MADTKQKSEVDLFSEKRLLQTLYHQPEFLDNPKVVSDIFQSNNTRNIYKALLELKENNIPFSRDALMQKYSTIDLNAEGKIVDLIVTSQTEQLSTIEDIIDQLLDARKRRTASALLRKAAEEIDLLTRIENVDEIKNLIGEGESYLVKEGRDTKKVLRFEEWSKEYEKELNLRIKGKQYWFNDFIFDSLVPDGPRPGEIGIIASSSGSGKSTLCLNLVNNLINSSPPVPCMYFSLEMSSIATMDRLMSNRLGIPYKDIVNPQPHSPEFEDYIQLFKAEKQNLFKKKRFRFSEDPSLSIRDLKKHIQKFQSEVGFNYCIVVLDLLSMLTDFNKDKNGKNAALVMEQSMNELSAVSKELGVHFIGVLQMNRSSEAGVKPHDEKDLEKFRPNRSQIKNAHAYLERSRYVITTFRKMDYARQYLPPEDYENWVDYIEVQVLKINNSETGKKSKGIFNPEFFSIEPVPEEENL